MELEEEESVTYCVNVAQRNETLFKDGSTHRTEKSSASSSWGTLVGFLRNKKFIHRLYILNIYICLI
jgi:hypothetical protein